MMPEVNVIYTSESVTLKITLDPNDPDQTKTVAMILSGAQPKIREYLGPKQYGLTKNAIDTPVIT